MARVQNGGAGQAEVGRLGIGVRQWGAPGAFLLALIQRFERRSCPVLLTQGKTSALEIFIDQAKLSIFRYV